MWLEKLTVELYANTEIPIHKATGAQHKYRIGKLQILKFEIGRETRLQRCLYSDANLSESTSVASSHLTLRREKQT
jgi:hypothetical protein